MFNKIGTTTGVGTNRWKKYKLESLYIKMPTDKEEELVTDIIKTDYNNLTLNNIYKIDKTIYKIYNLTTDEIELIENFLK